MPSPLAAVARRLAPPAAGTDADLLARFRLGRDEAAFAALVKRHGPAVRAVVRARLGNPADADDVVQATFLVLARDAGRVRESVAGWLVRVAQLTALQHRRNLARRRTDPLPEGLPVHADPADAAATGEARAVVVEELAGLPDRLRAVLVLCTLEGLTAAEAAARLGVPKGTVDSRLATAKRRLADRLARRGLAAGAGAAALEAVTADAAVAGVSEVAITTAAVSYAAGGAGFTPTAASLLADGVRSAMTSTARLFALGMVAAALTGSAGTALYHAGPAQPPDAKKPPAPAKKPADPPKPDATLTANAPPADGKPARLAGEAEVRAVLAGPSGIPDPSSLTLGMLLAELENRGMETRIDLPALMRAGMPQDMLGTLRDKKILSFGGSGTTLGDLLADATAGVTWGPDADVAAGNGARLTYWVSGSRVVLGPAYRTPSLPGSGGTEGFQPAISREQMMEQVTGPPVSLAADGLTLADAVKKLRGLTGANIVIDARARDQASTPVAGTFDDVRLLTVLQVLADQAGLKPVTLNNVYYLTTAENAVPLQKLADRDLHGTSGQPAAPLVPIPPGFVTDGYQYFPRTADMKPATPPGYGGLGGFGGGGPVPGTLPVPAGPAAKK